MNKRGLMISTFVFFVFALAANVCGPITTASKITELKPDLSKLVKGDGWQVSNRTASLIDVGTKKGVRFDERRDVGTAWLKDYKFKNGVIEFDVKGRNVLQKSFLGVAFHALDETTYDLIYFRPFNFKSDDPKRRGHSVQYIAAPTYSWQKLRAESPGKYEQPVQPVPDPDGWFHARIVIASPKISVFVNNATQPCLVVEKLNDRKEGLLGFWIGPDSNADFANLRIIPAK